MDSNPNAFSSLAPQALAVLAASLRIGGLSHDLSDESLQKSWPNLPDEACRELLRLHHHQSWSSEQIAYLLVSIRDAKTNNDVFAHLFDLVLSGPQTDAVRTRDTGAVFSELIETAESEILLASYAIYNGIELFAPLLEKHQNIPDFKTTIFLDIPRGRGDVTISSQIVAGYKNDFFTKQWLSDSHPELYYLKSSLELDWKARASMHAKIVVIDRKTVMISSANLTKAAQTKNIEAGAIIYDPKTAERLIDHFQSLSQAGHFVQI